MSAEQPPFDDTGDIALPPELIMDPEVKRALRYFNYSHLAPHLQQASRPFHDLAWDLAAAYPGPGLPTALRSLLLAKNDAVLCAVDLRHAQLTPREGLARLGQAVAVAAADGVPGPRTWGAAQEARKRAIMDELTAGRASAPEAEDPGHG